MYKILIRNSSKPKYRQYHSLVGVTPGVTGVNFDTRLDIKLKKVVVVKEVYVIEY
jgi:hypothetical protein